MGCRLELIPHLALRALDSYSILVNRNNDEFLPRDPQVEETYKFFKRGLRLYSVGFNIPLVETTGNCNLIRVVARIIILKSTVDALQDATYGEYRIKELSTPEKPLDYLRLVLEYPN